MYNNNKLKPFYESRRQKVKLIPEFWAHVIRGSAELLDPFMTFEDLDLLLKIKDLYVSWDEVNPLNFSIEFEFEPNQYLDDSHLILKKNFFYKEKKISTASSKSSRNQAESQDDKETEFERLQVLIEKRQREIEDEGYVSEPVPIKWRKGKNLTRINDTGINSFFSWFNYIGEGPGDFSGGQDLASIISEEIFPHATKFYWDGLLEQTTGEAEFDLDEDEDEEDIGNDEDDEVKGKKNSDIKYKDDEECESPVKKKKKT